MKKIIFYALLLLLLINTSQTFAQSCYLESLANVKADFELKNYKTVIIRINNVLKYCQDIPKDIPLEAIKRTALAFDSIDNTTKLTVVRHDSIRPVLNQNIVDEIFNNQIIKIYGLKGSDLFQSQRIIFDFNNDGLQDIAMLFYFEKKTNNNKNFVKFMNIAVFEQSKANTYTLKNRTDNNNLLDADCKLASLGIKSYEKMENCIFFFSNADKKCIVKCNYDTKTNKIQLIK